MDQPSYPSQGASISEHVIPGGDENAWDGVFDKGYVELPAHVFNESKGNGGGSSNLDLGPKVVLQIHRSDMGSLQEMLHVAVKGEGRDPTQPWAFQRSSIMEKLNLESPRLTPLERQCGPCMNFNWRKLKYRTQEKKYPVFYYIGNKDKKRQQRLMVKFTVGKGPLYVQSVPAILAALKLGPPKGEETLLEMHHGHTISLGKSTMPSPQLCVQHICNNAACLNPYHLRYGAKREDVQARWYYKNFWDYRRPEFIREMLKDVKLPTST